MKDNVFAALLKTNPNEAIFQHGKPVLLCIIAAPPARCRVAVISKTIPKLEIDNCTIYSILFLDLLIYNGILIAEFYES